MRKFLTAVIIATLLLLLSATALYAQDMKIIVNGDLIQVQSAMENGRTLVPLRQIFEKLGASVNWDSNTQTITAVGQSKVIALQINNKEAFVNGKSIMLDVPARLNNGITMVPLRFVGESFGAEVVWDSAANSITLNNKQVNIAPEKQKILDFYTNAMENLKNLEIYTIDANYKMDFSLQQENEKIQLMLVEGTIKGQYHFPEFYMKTTLDFPVMLGTTDNETESSEIYLSKDGTVYTRDNAEGLWQKTADQTYQAQDLNGISQGIETLMDPAVELTMSESDGRKVIKGVFDGTRPEVLSFLGLNTGTEEDLNINKINGEYQILIDSETMRPVEQNFKLISEAEENGAVAEYIITLQIVYDYPQNLQMPVIDQTSSQNTLPNYQLWLDQNHVVYRNVVEEDENSLTWVIVYNGETVLRRNANGETQYKYFRDDPGSYNIYLEKYDGSKYRVVSNVVSFVIK